MTAKQAPEGVGVGSLVAAATWGPLWLYRVTGETAKRWNVAIEHRPEGMWSSPHSGYSKPYFDKTDKRLIGICDLAQFEQISAAASAAKQARVEAESAYRARLDAIEAEYQSAIAKTRGGSQ